MPEPHRRRHDDDDCCVDDLSNGCLSAWGNALVAHVNAGGPRRKVQMHALREGKISDSAEQERKSGEDETQRQRGDQMQVQRSAPEDVRVRALFASSSLPEVPPPTRRSDHGERQAVQDSSHDVASRPAVLRGHDQITDAEEARKSASQDKTNAREGCQVVVELTQDEGGSALPLLFFAGGLVRGYQPRVCSSSSSASFATSSPRIGSPSPRDTFARMSGSW
jgi:hypothetical protein